MKNLFFKICEKILTGGYSVKIKNKYITFPKLAPIFFLGTVISSVGEVMYNDLFIYSGWGILLIFVFGFFYYNIFPNRIPK
jgi:hypothetical protein